MSECRKKCQKEPHKIVRKNVRKKGRRTVRKTVRTYVRKNVTRYVRLYIRKNVRKNVKKWLARLFRIRCVNLEPAELFLVSVVLEFFSAVCKEVGSTACPSKQRPPAVALALVILPRWRGLRLIGVGASQPWSGSLHGELCLVIPRLVRGLCGQPQVFLSWTIWGVHGVHPCSKSPCSHPCNKPHHSSSPLPTL